MVSAICNRLLFPPLEHLPDQELHLRKLAFKVATGILGALSATGAAATFFNIYSMREKRWNLETAGREEWLELLRPPLMFVASFVGGLSTLSLYEYAGKIDLILNRDKLSLYELAQNKLFHKFNNEHLQKKFQEMLNNPYKDDNPLHFFNILCRCDITKLIARGIAPIKTFRYSSYNIEPTEIDHSEVDSLFPLRSSLFSSEELSTRELKEEAFQQEKEYREFFSISRKYENRVSSWVDNMQYLEWARENLDAVEAAERQQKGFAEEIRRFKNRSSFGGDR